MRLPPARMQVQLSRLLCQCSSSRYRPELCYRTALCPSPEPSCATDPGRHALFCQIHAGLSPNTTAGWLRQQGCLDQCHAFLFTGCIICFSLPAIVKLQLRAVPHVDSALAQCLCLRHCVCRSGQRAGGGWHEGRACMAGKTGGQVNNRYKGNARKKAHRQYDWCGIQDTIRAQPTRRGVHAAGKMQSTTVRLFVLREELLRKLCNELAARIGSDGDRWRSGQRDPTAAGLGATQCAAASSWHQSGAVDLQVPQQRQLQAHQLKLPLCTGRHVCQLHHLQAAGLQQRLQVWQSTAIWSERPIGRHPAPFYPQQPLLPLWHAPAQFCQLPQVACSSSIG